MADNVILTRIKHATGTSAEWAAKASTLFNGELGYDSSNNKVKIGNGTARWTDLPWLKADSADKATSATSARYATTATSAASATNASTASYATSAGSASSATNASTATYASSAAKATSATSARYATTATSADSASKAASATSARYATTATSAGSATNASTASYAGTAGSAGSATYATYPCMTAGNEIRFHNGTGLTAGGEIWLGWAWASGDKTVTKNWRIGNFSGGGLANVYVDTLYGNVSGNVNGYTSTAGTATYATSAGSAGSATSASKATSATSARYATTATNAGTASYASSANSSSKATSATSARYATTASNAGWSSTSNLAYSLYGEYTSNGGAQPPSYVGTHSVRCNMMNQFTGTGTSFSSYADVLMMNAYSWSDVPYATALAIQKRNGIPRAWIAAGGNTSSWAGATELITKNNFAEQMGDYIVSQGTSGRWTYIKFNSGVAICWGLSDNKSTQFASAWGSLYCHDYLFTALSYPFTFTSRPYEFAWPYPVDHTALTGDWWPYTGGYNTTTQTTTWSAIRPTKPSAAVTIRLAYFVVGRWK